MTKIDCLFNQKLWPVVCLGLSLVLSAPSIFALGLGDIRVASKLGEHFIGRIPLIASPGESIDASCFKLLTESPNKQDGIPFIASARLTVNSGNGPAYIRVSSRKRISDLIVRLVIKAGCESETTREYTILLDLPGSETTPPDQVIVNEPLIESELPPKSVLPGAQRAHRPTGPEWESMAGDSLASIAASLYPNSQRQQRKFIRHAVAANPDVLLGKPPGALLPEGTLLHFPDLKEPERKSARKAADQPVAAGHTEQLEKKPDTPPVSQKPTRLKKTGADVEVRLKLTTSDLDVSASGKVTEGEREILREKQRILMDIDDMAAYNLSLNHRLKDMESHIQELHTKLDAMERQRSELAASRPAAPVRVTGTPAAPGKLQWEWSAYTNIFIFSAVGLVLLAVLYVIRKRKQAEVEALMGLDVDLDSEWESAPEKQKPVMFIAPAATVNTAEPPPAPVIDKQPAAPEAPKKPSGISETSHDVTLGSVECAIEEADIYIALGEGARAIANLKFQIDSEPKSTAGLWLKLLAIYHDLDMRPEFETLANGFHQHFNIEKPNWEKMAFAESSSGSIEQFPHLLEKIATSWGSPDCLEYLNHLLLDNKGGLREGFELGIASDILLLIRILELRGEFDELPSGESLSKEKAAVIEFVFEPKMPEDNVEVTVQPVIDPGTNPDNWRELLEIYRHADMRDEFVLFAESLSLNFNLTSPSWDGVTETAQNMLGIGHFPSLAREITSLWGTAECSEYLRKLLCAVRDGKRKGFDLGVSKELFLLLFILERQLEGKQIPQVALPLEISLEPMGATDESERSDLGLPSLDMNKFHADDALTLPPAESSPVSIDPRSALEKLHRRIVEQLISVWGEPEAASYLENLIADERGGRAGFDKEVIAELIMLFSMSVAEVAVEDTSDVWGLSGEKELAAQSALKLKKH